MATEKRLIDANILVRFAEALDKGEYDPALHAIRKKYLNGKGLKYLVDKCPTVDAVEVVRCKDCKKYRHPFCLLNDTQNGWLTTVSPDFFCAYGERKD